MLTKRFGNVGLDVDCAARVLCLRALQFPVPRTTPYMNYVATEFDVLDLQPVQFTRTHSGFRRQCEQCAILSRRPGQNHRDFLGSKASRVLSGFDASRVVDLPLAEFDAKRPLKRSYHTADGVP